MFLLFSHWTKTVPQKNAKKSIRAFCGSKIKFFWKFISKIFQIVELPAKVFPNSSDLTSVENFSPQANSTFLEDHLPLTFSPEKIRKPVSLVSNATKTGEWAFYLPGNGAAAAAASGRLLEESFFPTCQVRDVRLYRMHLVLLHLLLLLLFLFRKNVRRHVKKECQKGC